MQLPMCELNRQSSRGALRLVVCLQQRRMFMRHPPTEPIASSTDHRTIADATFDSSDPTRLMVMCLTARLNQEWGKERAVSTLERDRGVAGWVCAWARRRGVRLIGVVGHQGAKGGVAVLLEFALDEVGPASARGRRVGEADMAVDRGAEARNRPGCVRAVGVLPVRRAGGVGTRTACDVGSCG
jgi:hypothetical protein